MTSLNSIAARIQHYDSKDMHVDAVQAFLAQLVQPVTETETLDLRAAFGRVLAGDVISPISVPAHDNSAMDGFAFDGAALQPGQPLQLECIATALAGHAWSGTIASGQCVRIMTGAVMPAGLNTVVPLELTSTGADGRIHIPADTLRPGANRRRAGEDLMQGSVALASGERITPAALGLLASLGLAQVEVVRSLRVAYFSTGDEILAPGEPPREGAVYDSNRFALFGLLTKLGVEVLDFGNVPDQPEQLEAMFRKAAADADAIITSGGVSGGDADHTRALMNRLGDVAFWRIAMRPGRPMAVGLLDKSSDAPGAPGSPGSPGLVSQANRCLLFGLPGNPVATMVTFLAFVRPALIQMMVGKQVDPPLLRATCTETLRKRPGRTEYQRGIVSKAADGSLQVQTTGNQGSGVLSSMVHANGLIVLPHDGGTVHAGDPVDVMMFEGVV